MTFQSQAQAFMQFIAQGAIDKAIGCIEHLIELLPNDKNTGLQLAHKCLEIGAVGQSVNIIARLLDKAPTDNSLRLNLATAYLFSNNYEGAKSELKQLYSVIQNNPDALNMLGSCHSGLGEFSSAESMFNEALALNPAHGSAALGLVKCRRFTENDKTLLTNLQQAQSSTSDPIQQIKLCKAIAKILNDIGDYQQAWELAHNANSIFHQLSPYAGIESRKQSLQYLKEYPVELKSTMSDQHVLIVGMPRSGTTLIEQIVGNHNQYFQGGESPAIEFALQYGLNTNQYSAAQNASSQSLTKAAEGYNFYFEQFGAEKGKRIINKLPANYQHIGLFKQLFPQGKIVFAQRDYRDVIASIYFEEFSSPNSYTNRVDDIIAEYSLSLDILSHWQTMFPDDILQVNYEDVVQNYSSAVNRIAEFLSIDVTDIDDYESNTAAVNTPSLWQVRQGIYSSSKERYKRYLALKDLPENVSTN